MCQNAQGVHAKRELKQGGGKLVQCLVCGTVGVEFGTVYLAFAETEFVRFARWIDDLQTRTADSDAERRYIQLRGGGGTMLALDPHELRSLAELLRSGLGWLSGTVSRPVSVDDAPMETWVH